MAEEGMNIDGFKEDILREKTSTKVALKDR